jgi:hypothetical protein
MACLRSVATTSARSIVATVATAGLVALASPPARAQPPPPPDGRATEPTSAQAREQADALFERGKQLMEADRIDEACGLFDASNRIDPRAGTLIWIGECRTRNHQLASAWRAYQDALARVVDPRKKQIATAKLADVEDRLSYLLVVVDDGRRLDGLTLALDGRPLPIGSWNRGAPIDGGAHTLVAGAPGHAAWTTTVTVPDELGRIRVEVPALAPSAVPAVPAPTPSGPATAAAHRDAPSRWTPRRRLAVGLGAGSTAGWIVGAVLGVEARRDQRDAFALCASGQPSCAQAARANQLLDHGARRALGANLAFGAATALAIGAGLLWFTGAPDDAGVAVAPVLAPGHAGVVVRGAM